MFCLYMECLMEGIHPLDFYFLCWECVTPDRCRCCCHCCWCCGWSSYLSKLSAWSSSQFGVTLPSHARGESNLLWWKDKETLIEISPSGRLVLAFRMGLDKLFSSRLAAHAELDPSFTTTDETTSELSLFDSTWLCDTAERHLATLNKLIWINVKINTVLWREICQIFSKFKPYLKLTRLPKEASCSSSTSPTLASPEPFAWSTFLIRGNILEIVFPPDFHQHLPTLDSLKASPQFMLEDQRPSFFVIRKHPSLCFHNVFHQNPSNTWCTEPVQQALGNQWGCTF